MTYFTNLKTAFSKFIFLLLGGEYRYTKEQVYERVVERMSFFGDILYEHQPLPFYPDYYEIMTTFWEECQKQTEGKEGGHANQIIDRMVDVYSLKLVVKRAKENC